MGWNGMKEKVKLGQKKSPESNKKAVKQTWTGTARKKENRTEIKEAGKQSNRHGQRRPMRLRRTERKTKRETVTESDRQKEGKRESERGQEWANNHLLISF